MTIAYNYNNNCLYDIQGLPQWLGGKELPDNAGDKVPSLGWEDFLEEEMATQYSLGWEDLLEEELAIQESCLGNPMDRGT